jgi:hypothetical protein
VQWELHEGIQFLFMVSRNIWSQLSAGFVLILAGCSKSPDLPDSLTAHHIKYKIVYLDEQAGDIPTKILPGQMDAYYTDYFVLSRIEGFLEQFTLTQIADLKREKVTTLLRFFDSRFYYEGKNGELPVAIIEPDHMDCTLTGETTLIGGLHSERVEVDTGDEQFNIYLTKDFEVKRPNIATPYRCIDYPLSEFRVQLSLLKMHLSCKEFETKTIDSNLFDIPPEYRLVSKQDMEHIINSLFTKD